MNFHIITLFPDAFSSYLGESILKRAILDKKIKIKFYNPRDFDLPARLRATRGQAQAGKDKKWRVDQKPYGGGPGMVLRALPVVKAIERAIRNIERKTYNVKRKTQNVNSKRYKLQTVSYKIVWFSPSGKQFDTAYAKKIAGKYSDIILICGRYEGIDARVKKVYKVEEISVGPYVLTGGELPAEILMDCISRQVEGVLGNFDSLEESRISTSDVYTRPEIITYKSKKYRVPKILLSGHRAKIDEWKMSKRPKKS